MSASVTFKKGPKEFQKYLDRFGQKVVDAHNTAIRATTIQLFGLVRKKYLRVDDGSVTRVKRKRGSGSYIKASPRTTEFGLRRISGSTLNALGAALLTANNRRIKLTSDTNGVGLAGRIKGFMKAGFVGLDFPKYALDHERFGKQKKKGYYSFLSPALKDSMSSLIKTYDRFFLNIMRKKT